MNYFCVPIKIIQRTELLLLLKLVLTPNWYYIKLHSMINTDYHYMVDFAMPDVLNEEFMNLVPFQRSAVNKLFMEGKLLNYALSLENSRLWAVFSANSELEVMDMISDLPLTPFMKVEISLLTFYNTMYPKMPEFSKN